MYIYNVTIKVNWSIHDEWLPWMQEVHMPEVLQTGCFTEFRLLRLLETDENEGPTYAAQYYSSSKSAYERYIRDFAPILRQKVTDQWGQELIAFRSLMQVVQ